MSRQLRSLCALTVLSMVVACTHSPQAQAPPTAEAAKVAQMKEALRDLWVGHIFWIRNVAIATMDQNVAARDAAEKGVVANAESIARSIEPFYGKGASDKLFTLLAEHYAGLREYLDATAAGSSSQQGIAVKHLTANASEIATFLSGANPNLPKDTVMGLLMAHAAHHLTEFQQLKEKDYIREAETWAGMKQHIYVLADALTDALAKQFPDKV